MRKCAEEIERTFLVLEKCLRRWEHSAKQSQSLDVSELAAGSLLSGSLLALAWVINDPSFDAGVGLGGERRSCPAESLETVLRAVLDDAAAIN